MGDIFMGKWFKDLKRIFQVILFLGFIFIIYEILYCIVCFCLLFLKKIVLNLNPISPIINQFFKVFYSALYLGKNIFVLFIYLVPLIVIVGILVEIYKGFKRRK